MQLVDERGDHPLRARVRRRRHGQHGRGDDRDAQRRPRRSSDRRGSSDAGRPPGDCDAAVHALASTRRGAASSGPRMPGQPLGAHRREARVPGRATAPSGDMAALHCNLAGEAPARRLTAIAGRADARAAMQPRSDLPVDAARRHPCRPPAGPPARRHLRHGRRRHAERHGPLRGLEAALRRVPRAACPSGWRQAARRPCASATDPSTRTTTGASWTASPGTLASRDFLASRGIVLPGEPGESRADPDDGADDTVVGLGLRKNAVFLETRGAATAWPPSRPPSSFIDRLKAAGRRRWPSSRPARTPRRS